MSGLIIIVIGMRKGCLSVYLGLGTKMDKERKKMPTTKINPVEIETKVVDAQGNELVPVRHGHWINTGFLTAECSECGAEVHELEYGNYCPNCGAMMDEVEE